MNQKKSDQQQPAQGNRKADQRISGTKSRGGGQPKPRTPSGTVKPWRRPQNGTTPANRKK